MLIDEFVQIKKFKQLVVIRRIKVIKFSVPDVRPPEMTPLLFAGPLIVDEFALSGDVAADAFGCHVVARVDTGDFGLAVTGDLHGGLRKDLMSTVITREAPLWP